MRLVTGSSYSFVMDIIAVDSEKLKIVGYTYPCGKVVRVSGPFTWHEGFRGATIIAGRYVGFREVHEFSFMDQSQFLGHLGMTKDAMYSAIDTCSGMGISTAGILETGVRMVAANDKSLKMIQAYSQMHPDITTVHGDICQDQTLMDLHAAAPASAVLLAGFSCQPFSSGSSQRGGLDSRSCSLLGVLHAALLLRKPMIVLECVTSASSNRFVRSYLDTFCAQCGYSITEFRLKLEDVWVSKRDRWWAVLMVGALGQFHLRGWCSGNYPSVVKDVMPHAMSVSSDETCTHQTSSIMDFIH